MQPFNNSKGDILYTYLGLRDEYLKPIFHDYMYKLKNDQAYLSKKSYMSSTIAYLPNNLIQYVHCTVQWFSFENQQSPI